jgi:hypothetical protein
MKRLAVLAGLVLLAAALLYGLGRWDQHVSADEQRWAEHARMALAAGKAYRQLQEEGDRQLQKAQRAAQQARQQADRATELSDSLGREIEAAEATTGDMTSAEDSSRQWHTLFQMRTRQQMQTAAALTARTLERDELQGQVGVLTSQRDSARARVAQLEVTVAQGLEVKECRILGLVRCPSRGVMFVAGVGTTLLTREALEALRKER